MAKHLFVTGGVVSSIGKGLTSASIGMLLEARGLRVRMQKLDPYINVDPGAPISTAKSMCWTMAAKPTSIWGITNVSPTAP
jgi:hypothetical protein